MPVEPEPGKIYVTSGNREASYNGGIVLYIRKLEVACSIDCHHEVKWLDKKGLCKCIYTETEFEPVKLKSEFGAGTIFHTVFFEDGTELYLGGE